MKMTLIILLCRLISFVGNFFGKGTDLPGKIALKLYPTILGKLTFKGKVVFVTGSNGKTTTANLIAHILRENGYTVANNSKGSNISSGLASLLLSSCNLKGHSDYDFTVLEVDERYTRVLAKYVEPDYFLITNLLRDQVVRNGHPDIIRDIVEQAVRPKTVMILNANDPVSQTIGMNNKRVFFAMDKTSRSTRECVSGTHDCKVCPHCFHKLNYRYYHYNHIGSFVCESCGYKTPDTQFIGRNVDFEKGCYTMNGVKVNFTYNATFYVFNTMAAITVCRCLGLSLKQAAAKVSTFEVSAQRFETFKVKDRDACIILTKYNPPSLDQSIAYISQQKGEKTVIFYVNDVLYGNCKDVSWLYDVAFGNLHGKADHFVCAGSRAWDVAVAMKLSGFSADKLIIEPNLENIGDVIDRTSGDIYVLAAYAFGKENKILGVLKSL